MRVPRDAAGDEQPGVMCSAAFFLLFFLLATLVGFDFLLVVVDNRV